jgi:hypothetical protein
MTAIIAQAFQKSKQKRKKKSFISAA